MSTLFLIGNVDSYYIEGKNSERYFDRIVNVSDFNELFVQLYRDRVSSLPNKWNYETDISLVVYNPSNTDSSYSIRQINEIFRRFLPTFNIMIMESSDKNEVYDNVFKLMQSEKEIVRDRILKVNHWMFHHHQENGNDGSFPKNETQACESNIYSMLDHLSFISNNSNKNVTISVPRVIRNITFKDLLIEENEQAKPDEESYYLQLLSTWNFNVLKLTTTQLIKCGFHLLNHLSNLADLPIPEHKLHLLLFTIEASYHQINKFHNFKHAIDVMQATWQLCQKLLPDDNQTTLLLCLAAIGHDIGHPGTNNVLFNGSIMNDMFQSTSILEKFHFKVFNQLLIEQWNKIATISKKNSDLIENAILATDMSLHSKYVQMLENKSKKASDFTQAELVSLIIKAADISNVTRPLDISARWALLITLEFKDCALLNEFTSKERDGFNNCHLSTNNEIVSQDDDMDFEHKTQKLLCAEPFSVDSLVSDYPTILNGQLFFIDTFAYTFFDRFANKFPSLKFLIDNVNSNKEYWLNKKEELEK